MLRKLIELPEGASTRPKPAPLGPRKKNDYENNVRHWADLCEADFSPESRNFFKTDTSLALRGAMVAQEEGRFREYHYPMYRARWAEPRDLSEPAVVHQHLAEAGMDADATLARAESSELIERLEAETHSAIERGVFGVPALFVGDEMFWGNDRFELVRHYLDKQPPS